MREDKFIKAFYRGLHEFLEGLRGDVEERSLIKQMMDDYIKTLSPSQQLMIKSILRMPWNEFVDIFYQFLLNLGRDENGYKTTEETLVRILKEYVRCSIA